MGGLSRSISLPGFMFQKSGDAFAQDCSVSVGFVCTVGAIVFNINKAGCRTSASKFQKKFGLAIFSRV